MPLTKEQMLSPMQAIQDYERSHGMPSNWINYAIRYAAPNGHWQKLERGEIKLDAGFFKGFTSDLQSNDAWKKYQASFQNGQTKLKDLANPTQLGDHVSLKAETVDSNLTEEDKGSTPDSIDQSTNTKPSLTKLAKDKTIGDPVSLESEAVLEPPSERSTSSSSSRLQTSPRSSNSSQDGPPEVDGEDLFWKMMSASRHPDPYIFPVLERLSGLQPRPIIAALSNTVTFPPDHPWSKPESFAMSSSADSAVKSQAALDLKSYFNVYVSSSEIGLRKPSPEAYELTIRKLNEYSSRTGGEEIRAEDIIFLDDIGENVKAARNLGMRTIKVQMGKTWRAVKVLEDELGGVELLDEKTRRSKL